MSIQITLFIFLAGLLAFNFEAEAQLSLEKITKLQSLPLRTVGVNCLGSVLYLSPYSEIHSTLRTPRYINGSEFEYYVNPNRCEVVPSSQDVLAGDIGVIYNGHPRPEGTHIIHAFTFVKNDLSFDGPMMVFTKNGAAAQAVFQIQSFEKMLRTDYDQTKKERGYFVSPNCRFQSPLPANSRLKNCIQWLSVYRCPRLEKEISEGDRLMPIQVMEQELDQWAHSLFFKENSDLEEMEITQNEKIELQGIIKKIQDQTNLIFQSLELSVESSEKQYLHQLQLKINSFEMLIKIWNIKKSDQVSPLFSDPQKLKDAFDQMD